MYERDIRKARKYGHTNTYKQIRKNKKRSKPLICKDLKHFSILPATGIEGNRHIRNHRKIRLSETSAFTLHNFARFLHSTFSLFFYPLSYLNQMIKYILHCPFTITNNIL